MPKKAKKQTEVKM